MKVGKSEKDAGEAGKKKQGEAQEEMQQEKQKDKIILNYLIVLIFLLLNISIFAPPFLIWAGDEGTAAFLYNLHSYDHQWIYRSQCVFNTTSGLIIDDCIKQGEESNAKIYTLYTKNGAPYFNNTIFIYDQRQIGINKAEKVERDGMVGYKFANDTRDYAIYVPWMIAMALYPLLPKRFQKKPQSILPLLLALVPLGIDGTTQLLAGMFQDPNLYWLSIFGLKESTNLLRWITGAIIGFVAGYYASSFILE